MHRLYYTLILISSISVIITLIYSVNGGNSFVFYLPLSFLFILILFINLFINLLKSFVFKIFLLQAAIRYLLLPILYSGDQNLGVVAYSKSIDLAIVVMIVELFVISLVFAFFSKLQIKTLGNKAEMKYINGNIFVPIILILMFFIIYISGFLGKINFIWELEAYVDQYINQDEKLEVSAFGALLFNSFKVILILYIISLIQKFSFIQNKKWFILAVIFLSCLVIVGVSRFSMILDIAVLIGMLSFILNKKENRQIVMILLPTIILILGFVSIAKFSRYGESYSVNSLITAMSINSYFSGFGNISIGIQSYSNIEWNKSIYYLFNDTFQNIPILSNFTGDEYKTNRKFNETIYGHTMWADQIVPLSISGLYHFGYLGLFLYSPFFISIALLMERLAYKVNYIGYKYFFLYISLVFSLIFMINLSSFYASFSRTFLFLLIPLFLLKILTNLRIGYRK